MKLEIENAGVWHCKCLHLVFMKFTPGCKTALIVLLKYYLNLLCQQKEQEIILLGNSNMFFICKFLVQLFDLLQSDWKPEIKNW